MWYLVGNLVRAVKTTVAESNDEKVKKRILKIVTPESRRAQCIRDARQRLRRIVPERDVQERLYCRAYFACCGMFLPSVPRATSIAFSSCGSRPAASSAGVRSTATSGRAE